MKKIAKHYLSGVCFLVLIIAVPGCSSQKNVERTDKDGAIALRSCRLAPRIEADTTIDLSGRWNDTDSREVSEAIILDCLNHPWITNHMTHSRGVKPIVIVGAIRNKSMEHIAINTFINDIERAIINSGRVAVVASAEERGELRAEKEDQREFASVETIKGMGREQGADYMMTGEINTIQDREGGTQVTYYQADLNLTNIETNQKVWLGQKKIKKLIERKKAVF